MGSYTMGYFRLPLSGDVWQDINPFRWVFGPDAQFNLFSINMGRSSDPKTEQAVLEVASYGRQLGRMSEVLQAILENTNTTRYSKDQKRQIDDFKALMREIGDAKKRVSK
jgi:hypothetical protein